MSAALLALALLAAAQQQPVAAPRAAGDTARVAADSAARPDSGAAHRRRRGFQIGIGSHGVGVQVTDEDSTGTDSARTKRPPPKRIPVTPALLVSAFRDVGARQLLERARAARLVQDSSLGYYDAESYQRLSLGMGLKRLGRDRLFMRMDNASRIRWARGAGAWVDVKGARMAFPMIKKGRLDDDGDDDDAITDMTELPYYPGREQLFIGSGLARAEVDEREIVHPLATGSEAYYRYATGDSMSFRLPTGKVYRLRELVVRPREPRWNLVVGSFWFDVESGHLVRAAYRLSVDMDIWAVARDASADAGEADPRSEVPFWVRPMIDPMRATVTAITQEYGLFNARWWLPRTQVAQGDAQVGFMHVPFKIEQRYDYDSVGGTTEVPELARWRAAQARTDSLAKLERDSLAEIRRTRGDSAYRLARRELRVRARARRGCAAGDSTWTTARTESDDGVRVVLSVPCDTARLFRAPELPPLYGEGDELFGDADLEMLMAEARSLSAQAGWAPQPPQWHYGLGDGLTRYNRVEGLSLGARVDVSLGAGYTGSALARLGTADLQPSGELTLARSGGARTARATIYRRLDVASDWGTPLDFGASLGALLFGRDEGFYYRAWGGELGWRSRRFGGDLDWRVFGEQQWSAPVKTQLSLANAWGDARFPANVEAARAVEGGTALRHVSSRGLDPHGWRLLSDLRLEGAAGDFDYGRGALDLTLSHGLGPWLDGALTVGGGTTGGTVPPQRLFFLGGTQTVRGQAPGVAVGNAYWLARGELGTSFVGARPVIFGDLGWAGDRRDWHGWRTPGRPLAGAGVGASFLDGMIRFDLARGLFPRESWRGNAYLEARF